MLRHSIYDILSKHIFRRKVSTLVRVVADFDENMLKEMECNKIKPKNHPGIINHNLVTLPHDVKAAILKVIGDTPLKQLMNEGKHFNSFIQGRQAQVDKGNYKEKRSLARKEVKDKLGVETDTLSENELKEYRELVNIKTDAILKTRIYNWRKLDFTRHLGLVYLVGRGASEYAVIYRIFNEIFVRTKYKPKRIFDLGTGIGTVIWAANTVWKDSIQEYYCVDTCRNMIDLSEEMINEMKDDDLKKKIFYRQFLPSSNDLRYDLVVCAFTLLEFPSKLTRLETISRLWNKTTKFLVLVEAGTKSGFKVLNETREFILSSTVKEDEGKRFAYLFAPCPHEFECPLDVNGESCNFQVSYVSYPGPEVHRKETFSYLVFVKGQRHPEDPQWPRIIKPVLNRSRHAICRICTNSGALQEVILSPAKYGKIPYRCAKSSRQGDLLPCSIKYITQAEKDEESIDEDNSLNPI